MFVRILPLSVLRFKFIWLLALTIVCPVNSYAQEKIEVSGSLDASYLFFDKEAPFWFYTNTNGLRSGTTNVALSAFAKANYSISENHHLEVGVGAFLRDGFSQNFQRSQLYLDYENKLFSITVGAKDPDIFNSGLSTINNNILLTGNTRAIPGILLKNTNALWLTKWLSADVQMGHYRLNDDRRTSKTNIHYKSLDLNWQLSSSLTVSTGLKHYVQWGGVTETGLELPNDFNALATVFVGAGASNLDNFNESINALGNHLGSYQLTFKKKYENNKTLTAYHHTLFEDRSGRELNNFPDGVWGVFLENTNGSWFKGALYEYVQTISQSGRPRDTQGPNQQSGGDNYFSNSIYRSGWTYEGVTIGLPFINPVLTNGNPPNTRIIAHHFGLLSSINKVTITTKITYLQNLGTYRFPFDSREKILITYINASREFDNIGKFSLFLGADFSENSNNSGAGLQYSYQF